MPNGNGYMFITDLNIIYSVIFDMSVYADHLEKFPLLLQEGYGFSFFPESSLEDKTFDQRVSQTIKAIAFDFINSQSDDVFLLYHCEARDGKQKARNTLYNRWYRSFEQKDKTVKQGLEVEIKTEAGETINHYIGFIAKCSNKQIDAASEELEEFAVDLINTNKS